MKDAERPPEPSADELGSQPVSRPSAQESGAADRSRLGEVASAIAGGLDSLASSARRAIGERDGARVRRVRRMGHQPLRNLWAEHPEARRAALREFGLQSVPIEAVAGSAVEGPTQRGGDFLPLRERRSDDWRSRWQRIRAALERLDSLPPIDVIRFGDEYWVVDGHNRVAAALYNGQVEIDALVQEMRLPGMPARPAQPIASVLDGSLALRRAGGGRPTRDSERPNHGHEPEE